MTSQPTEVPPPLQDLPDAKTRKYDRQLRLWGAAGQVALEETHILLVNSGPGVTGVETLKNLVLPGIGKFTIQDSAVVSEADLGVNFFLEDASLGKFRADETCRLLQELNPDVTGYAVKEPLESWATSTDALAPYTLILITTPIATTALELLQQHAAAREIPLFYVHSVGFYSHFSVQLPAAFPIVDTHPDPSATTDLRLLTPWPELEAFAVRTTKDMSAMDGEEFAHIPWTCLLLHYLKEWKATHEGKPPQTYKEKTEFRNLVRAGSQTEENFDEACAAVLKSLNPPEVPSAARDILLAPEAQSLSATSPPFWVIAASIHDFVTTHGQLPLPGAVPDMKARSNTYLELQTIYKNKARQDCAWVTAAVRERERTTQRPTALLIDDKEIENFCKNASHVALVRGRPLRIGTPSADIPLRFPDTAKSLASQLTNPESLIAIYIAFQAWDLFTATHTTSAPSEADASGVVKFHIPGADYDADTIKLTGIAEKIVDDILNEAGQRLGDDDYFQVRERVGQICMELARAEGGELHNIASLTGGMVAQEIIKVITKQYVPVDNTVVFDGVESRTGVLRV